MSTWWFILIAFAAVTVVAMLATAARRGGERPRLAPRRGDDPTPDRNADAVPVAGEVGTGPDSPNSESERAVERRESERVSG